jgi:hypothetical protein
MSNNNGGPRPLSHLFDIVLDIHFGLTDGQQRRRQLVAEEFGSSFENSPRKDHQFAFLQASMIGDYSGQTFPKWMDLMRLKE